MRHLKCFQGKQKAGVNLVCQSVGQSIPVKVSVQGLIPANLLDVPKSDIFKTPL